VEKWVFILSGVAAFLLIAWVKLKSLARPNIADLDRSIENIKKEKTRTQEELDEIMGELDHSLDTLSKLRRERGEQELSQRKHE
jgi:septal ring factor EnvC (AmiA/AmiB activator)